MFVFPLSFVLFTLQIDTEDMKNMSKIYVMYSTKKKKHVITGSLEGEEHNERGGFPLFFCFYLGVTLAGAELVAAAPTADSLRHQAAQQTDHLTRRNHKSQPVSQVLFHQHERKKTPQHLIL